MSEKPKYIAYPWCTYSSDEIRDYLKNTRHIISSNTLSAIKCDFLEKTENFSLKEWRKLVKELVNKCEVCSTEKIREIFDGLEENFEANVSDTIKFSSSAKTKYDELVKDFKAFYHIIELFDDLTECAKEIYKRCGLDKEMASIKWVSDLEKTSEYLTIDGEKTIILSYSQICDFTKVIISASLTNEDSLGRFKRPELVEKLEKEDPKEYIKWTTANGIDPEDFLKYAYEREINYEIIIKDIYAIMADVLFVHEYYDAAFHYIEQSNILYRREKKIGVREKLYNLFKKGGITAWKTVLMRECGIFLMAHEIHHMELEREGNVPLNKLAAWYFGEMGIGEQENDDIWNSVARGINERSHLIIKELTEGIGNDKVAYELLNASKPEIISWTHFYNIYSDIQKRIDNKDEGIGDIGQIIEESYCDFMALYDILEAESDCKLEDVFFAIDTIIRILTIQETNHMVTQMIGFLEGKVKHIKPRHISRIQLFVNCVLNEMYTVENGHDIDPEFRKYVPLFNVFMKFADESNFKKKLNDGIECILEGLDEVHEFYYKSVIYTVFHMYQDGYITKDFKGMYIKKEKGKEQCTGVVNAEAVGNAFTHDELVSNVQLAMKREQMKNPKLDFMAMDPILQVLNIDEILHIYSEMHKNIEIVH